MSNRKTGNAFETRFCVELFDHGFWVHNMTQNAAGQPADVIAVRNGKPFLIDCKVCENGMFPLSRIEPNQHTAMTLWKQCGNDVGWFALELNDSIYMFDHDLMMNLALSRSIVNEDDLLLYGQALEKWVKRW